MNKTGGRVRLVAGFLPRGLARLLVQEGEQAAYAQAQALGYLHQQDIQVRITVVLFSFLGAHFRIHIPLNSDPDPSSLAEYASASKLFFRLRIEI
jgi:hypothetical protein